MTIGGARAEGAALLRSRGVDTPELDAALLLAHSLGVDKTRLILMARDRINDSAMETFRAYLERRTAGTCVAYILGRKEFRGLEFSVGPAVLVPRPDTEVLVEAALEYLSAAFPVGAASGGRRPRILDVCTGSGCIAVSLAAERPDALVSACDLSPEALGVARLNAGRLLPGRLPPPGASEPDHPAPAGSGDLFSISFYQSDLLASVPGAFDLIVSNPPYVPAAVIDTLAAEVRGEPRMALDGGEDGLDLIRRLVQESSRRLDQGGRILVESGSEQTGAVADLMRGAGFGDIRTYRDLADLGRVTGAALV